MKRLPSSVALCVLFSALLLQADFTASAWKFQRPLPVPDGTPLAVVNMERGIYMNSQANLADLRVVSGQEEVPYVLEKLSGSNRRTEVSSGALNQGATRSGDLELTVDVGRDQRHNGIRLATTRKNFRQRVSISTGDGAGAWTRVRDDGYIFDFSQDDRHVSVLDVGYPISTRRYVRITVHGWNDPQAVTQCWVTLEESTPPVRDVMAALTPEPQPDSKTRSTAYTWDLRAPGIPHDEISLDVGTPAFQRAAAVETSKDGKQWSALGQGLLSRFHPEQSVALDFPESHQRYFRLRIYNLDDRPLSVNSAKLSVIRTRLKFRPEQGGSVFLFYGNPGANAPSYDLRDLLARAAPSPESTVLPGPEEPNPAYREKPSPSRPWSEQHPEILYVTLALAVLAMGTITIRFFNKVGAQGGH